MLAIDQVTTADLDGLIAFAGGTFVAEAPSGARIPVGDSAGALELIDA